MPSAPVCIMENEAGSEYLFKKCSRKPLLQGDLSHHGVKEKYQPLYQKLVLNMVNPAGVEPTACCLGVPKKRSPSEPINTHGAPYFTGFLTFLSVRISIQSTQVFHGCC